MTSRCISRNANPVIENIPNHLQWFGVPAGGSPSDQASLHSPVLRAPPPWVCMPANPRPGAQRPRKNTECPRKKKGLGGKSFLGGATALQAPLGPPGTCPDPKMGGGAADHLTDLTCHLGCNSAQLSATQTFDFIENSRAT